MDEQLDLECLVKMLKSKNENDIKFALDIINEHKKQIDIPKLKVDLNSLEWKNEKDKILGEWYISHQFQGYIFLYGTSGYL